MWGEYISEACEVTLLSLAISLTVAMEFDHKGRDRTELRRRTKIKMEDCVVF